MTPKNALFFFFPHSSISLMWEILGPWKGLFFSYLVFTAPIGLAYVLSPSLNLSDRFPFLQFHIPCVMVNVAVRKRAICPTFPIHHSCYLRPGSVCLVDVWWLFLILLLLLYIFCCWDIYPTACSSEMLEFIFETTECHKAVM
jgi:hypothetical protein